MMKKRMKALLAIGLSAIIMVCSAGCGNGKEHMKAETDPDTPVEDVSFPLKEKAELSFITSAPATSTQEPNERTIFKRLEKQTNVHIDWAPIFCCKVSIDVYSLCLMRRFPRTSKMMDCVCV